jgi:5-(carboxyamino)imidazole ribonucleotide mutase
MSVLIIMGSKSDAAIAEKVTKTLDTLGVKHKTVVASAHRTPEYLMKIVKESDASIFIGIAGLSAALPGAIASYTHRPVIGVPVSGKVNLDSILSITQMPPGVPVAAVGLDNGENAALLAGEILALNDPSVNKKILAYREEKRKAILEGN